MEKQKLPNATAVLVLGIFSILTCWCYGILGIILGGLSLFLAQKDSKLYKSNPDNYSNYQNLNIGRVLSIIGLVLSLLMIALMIWLISIVGVDGLNNQPLMEQRIHQYFGV